MSSFDQREKGFENKYIHDQERDFKIRTRRNKLAGIWAAEKMKLKEQDATAYAASLVSDAVEGVPDENLIAKILKDLTDKEVKITEDQLKEEMERFYAEAKKAFE